MIMNWIFRSTKLSSIMVILFKITTFFLSRAGWSAAKSFTCLVFRSHKYWCSVCTLSRAVRKPPRTILKLFSFFRIIIVDPPLLLLICPSGFNKSGQGFWEQNFYMKIVVIQHTCISSEMFFQYKKVFIATSYLLNTFDY